MSNIPNYITLPWLIMGDFNDITNSNEKFGGRQPSRVKMEPFLKFLNIANLLDLGFMGLKFTWTNCRGPNSLIRTRIDRANVNAGWLNLFPDAQVTHLPRLISNHCLILLQTHQNYNKDGKPFRFEPFWMKHPIFIEETSKIWQHDQFNLTQTIL